MVIVFTSYYLHEPLLYFTQNTPPDFTTCRLYVAICYTYFEQIVYIHNPTKTFYTPKNSNAKQIEVILIQNTFKTNLHSRVETKYIDNIHKRN